MIGEKLAAIEWQSFVADWASELCLALNAIDVAAFASIPSVAAVAVVAVAFAVPAVADVDAIDWPGAEESVYLDVSAVADGDARTREVLPLLLLLLALPAVAAEK